MKPFPKEQQLHGWQSGPKPKKPIPKESAKRKQTKKEYEKVRKAFLEKNPICQFDGCKRFATDCHHQAGKVGDDYADPTYFLAVCRTHHQWIEMHPKEAKQLGYSVTRLGNRDDIEIYK